MHFMNDATTKINIERNEQRSTTLRVHTDRQQRESTNNGGAAPVVVGVYVYTCSKLFDTSIIYKMKHGIAFGCDRQIHLCTGSIEVDVNLTGSILNAEIDDEHNKIVKALSLHEKIFLHTSTCDIPLPIRVCRNVRKVSYGLTFIVFSDRNHSLWSIGFNNSDPKKPFLFSDAFPVSEISAGDSHFLVINEISGQVFGSGSGKFGQLGIGRRITWSDQLLQCACTDRCIDISAGSNYSAIVNTYGLLYTFGSGAYFRLGHGDDCDRMYPTRNRLYLAQLLNASSVYNYFLLA